VVVEPYAAALTVEQRDAEFGFEPEDGPAHRRLGDP
jgi:hypothetical protein